MLELRKAVPADFPEVWDFYGRLIDGMAGAQFHPGWERDVYPSEEFVRSSLERGELFTAWLEGVMAGAMVINHACTPGYETVAWAVDAAPEEVSVIHALGISPDFQGRGVAGELVRGAVRLAREAGQKAIRLDVLNGNLPAQKLYAAAGFQYRGSVRLFYEDTGMTDFLLYELPLTQIGDMRYEIGDRRYNRILAERWIKTWQP